MKTNVRMKRNANDSFGGLPSYSFVWDLKGITEVLEAISDFGMDQLGASYRIWQTYVDVHISNSSDVALAASPELSDCGRNQWQYSLAFF